MMFTRMYDNVLEEYETLQNPSKSILGPSAFPCQWVPLHPFVFTGCGVPAVGGGGKVEGGGEGARALKDRTLQLLLNLAL